VRRVSPAILFFRILLALGTAGITFEVLMLYLSAQHGPGYFARTWSWCTLSAGAIAVSLMMLHRLHQISDESPDYSQQLYMGDLLTISFAVALFLSAAKNIFPEEFLRYGASSAGVIAMAMVLALLRASRKGYSAGMARGIYAIGCVLSVLGGSTLAALLLADIVRKNYWMNYRDCRLIISAQIFSGVGLIIGQSFCLLACWIRKQRTGPGQLVTEHAV
jgi:hypothetical protein